MQLLHNSGQNSQAVQDRKVVFLCVFGWHITPKTAVVLANKGRGVDAVINQVRIHACCRYTRCPSGNKGRFRWSGVGSLVVVVAWLCLSSWLIGGTPLEGLSRATKNVKSRNAKSHDGLGRGFRLRWRLLALLVARHGA